MKISLMVAGIVLAGSTLAACGGSDNGDGDGASGSYCGDIKSAQSVFESLSKGDLGQLQKGFTTFHQLAAESPEDVKAEWKILDDAATSIEGALDEAGLKMSDLASVQAGKIPAGVDMTKLAGFAADLQKLNNSEFADARAKIAKQAKDACGVELGSL